MHSPVQAAIVHYGIIEAAALRAACIGVQCLHGSQNLNYKVKHKKFTDLENIGFIID